MKRGRATCARSASSMYLCMLMYAELAIPSHAWTQDCTPKQCSISASAINSATGMKHASLKLVIARDDSDAELIATTPLGTALEPGVRLIFQSFSIKLTYKVCYPDGCRAYTPLLKAELDQLLEAQELELQFFAQANARPLSARLPVAGLAEALPRSPSQ
jgi:invasion protein IalB